MKHQRLLDPSRAPRDGFPFTDPDTGYTSHGKTLESLVATATLHRTANGLAMPDDFPAYVETQVCRMFPGRGVNVDGTPEDVSCQHRGIEIRRVGCVECGGVQAKIMACAIHGECTVFRHDVGVRRCGLCLDRVSLLTPEEQ